MADANAVIDILKGIIGQQAVQIAALQVTIDELSAEHVESANKDE